MEKQPKAAKVAKVSQPKAAKVLPRPRLKLDLPIPAPPQLVLIELTKAVGGMKVGSQKKVTRRVGMQMVALGNAKIITETEI